MKIILCIGLAELFIRLYALFLLSFSYAYLYNTFMYIVIYAKDVYSYYIECPILWQFARETLRLQEDSVSLASRLCIVSPSLCKLRLLAFVHTLYHALKNEPRALLADGFPVSPQSMQSFATEINRSLKSYIPGGHR